MIEWLAVTNTRVIQILLLITVVKCFIVQAPTGKGLNITDKKTLIKIRVQGLSVKNHLADKHLVEKRRIITPSSHGCRRQK